MLRLALLCMLMLISGAGLRAAELSVTLRADRPLAFVHEQVLLTLEIKILQSAFGLTGEEPSIDGVEIVSLHKSETEVVENAVAYKVITRVFALFARSATMIEIPPLRYQALLPVPSQRSDGKTGNPELSAASLALQLEIKTPPPGGGRIWFAAEDVSIQSRWSNPSASVRAGEPVTHELTISVRGQHPAAIPAALLQSDGTARLYPLAAELESAISRAGVTGVRRQLTSVIAPEEGLYAFQLQAIDWWDINAGRWRQATLPAAQFQFTEADQLIADYLWPRQWYQAGLLLLAAIAVVSVVTSALLWRRLRQLRGGNQKVATLTERRAWRECRRSINASKPSTQQYAQVRAAVLVWAGSRWPQRSIRQLEQLAQIDPRLRAQILALDAAAFGRAEGFDRRQFLAALKRLRALDSKPAPALPALYPDWDR